VDAVVHFAAAVGVGQSMYEIERYTSINRSAPRCCWKRSSSAATRSASYSSPRRCRSTAKASTATHGRARRGSPPVAAETQLAARNWDVLADDGTPLEPEPTAETKLLRPTSIYAIGKRDHEEMVLAVGAAYGIPAVRSGSSTSTAKGRRFSIPTRASPRSSRRAC